MARQPAHGPLGREGRKLLQSTELVGRGRLLGLCRLDGASRLLGCPRRPLPWRSGHGLHAPRGCGRFRRRQCHGPRELVLVSGLSAYRVTPCPWGRFLCLLRLLLVRSLRLAFKQSVELGDLFLRTDVPTLRVGELLRKLRDLLAAFRTPILAVRSGLGLLPGVEMQHREALFLRGLCLLVIRPQPDTHASRAWGNLCAISDEVQWGLDIDSPHVEVVQELHVPIEERAGKARAVVGPTLGIIAAHHSITRARPSHHIAWVVCRCHERGEVVSLIGAVLVTILLVANLLETEARSLRPWAAWVTTDDCAIPTLGQFMLPVSLCRAGLRILPVHRVRIPAGRRRQSVSLGEIENLLLVRDVLHVPIKEEDVQWISRATVMVDRRLVAGHIVRHPIPESRFEGLSATGTVEDTLLGDDPRRKEAFG